jgi:hypothetical protein
MPPNVDCDVCSIVNSVRFSHGVSSMLEQKSGASMNENERESERERRVAIALRELIEALDRRVPHVERLGEERIAREAAILRQQAATRLEELRTSELDLQTRQDELSDAVMSDDGAPQPNAAKPKAHYSVSMSRSGDE